MRSPWWPKCYLELNTVIPSHPLPSWWWRGNLETSKILQRLNISNIVIVSLWNRDIVRCSISLRIWMGGCFIAEINWFLCRLSFADKSYGQISYLQFPYICGQISWPRLFGESSCLSSSDISWTETLLYYSHIDISLLRCYMYPLPSTAINQSYGKCNAGVKMSSITLSTRRALLASDRKLNSQHLTWHVLQNMGRHA